jgi:hypothetical protein
LIAQGMSFTTSICQLFRNKLHPFLGTYIYIFNVQVILFDILNYKIIVDLIRPPVD